MSVPLDLRDSDRRHDSAIQDDHLLTDKHRLKARPSNEFYAAVNRIARALRYLAGKNNHVCAYGETLCKLTRFSRVLPRWRNEMVTRGWIHPPERDWSKHKGPYVYRFTDSFPFPPKYFTRQARRFIEEITTRWPGVINSGEISVLCAIAIGASSNRDYDRGVHFLLQATQFEFVAASGVYDVLERLVKKHYITITARNPLALRFAGPSGVMDVPVSASDAPHIRFREPVLKYIRDLNGHPLRVNSAWREIGCSCMTLTTVLSWLVKHHYISLDPQIEKGLAKTYHYLKPLSLGSFPNRAQWLKKEMEKRHLSIKKFCDSYNAPARNTLRSVLRGEPVTEKILESIRQVLSQHGHSISPSQIPND